jgi:hypothetical protein
MPEIRRIFEKVDEKKEQKKRRTAGIIIAVIMLFSTAAFAFMESTSNTNSNSQKYKDHTFQLTESGWKTTVNGQSIVTQYLPQDVENISSAQFISGNLGSTIYFVANSYDEKQAASELSNILNSQRKQFACLPEDSNSSECLELPLKDCNSASSDSGIVIIKESNESSISYSNFCITIKGNATDLVREVDKTIFKIVGII